MSKVREYTPRIYNYPEREAQNRKLGLKGEAFVLKYEQYRLISAGRKDLAQEVEWTSQEKGDGAGYDLRSFRVENKNGNEKELYIEVKTTKSGKYMPFYITDNEIAFAQEHVNDYSLYRVFDFKEVPRLFIVNGCLTNYVRLLPKLYSASF